MKITALVENTSYKPEYGSKHGLSFHIETDRHKLLFDMGTDNLFLDNAGKRQIDIKAVDLAVISHGHDDHGGALKLFLEHNEQANVYIRETAFREHYAKVAFVKEYIGLEQRLKADERIVLTEERLNIDQELFLFSNVKGSKLRVKGNRSLYVKEENKFRKDDFIHEQSLIISHHGKLYLFAGCAHSGIINILERAEEICGCQIDYVFSGFHLYNPILKKTEKKEMIEQLAEQLLRRKTIFYTCHCTGKKAFAMLRNYMGERIRYISAGMEVKL